MVVTELCFVVQSVACIVRRAFARVALTFVCCIAHPKGAAMIHTR